MKHEITRAPFRGYGAFQSKEGVYFAASLSAFADCGVNIYNLSDETREYRFPFDRSMCYGDVYSVYIRGLSLKGRGYRFFCGSSEIVDTYARGIYGNESFGEGVDPARLYALIPPDREPGGFDNDRPLCIPYEDSVIYQAHVRGLTMGDPSMGKTRGTFRGIISRIPYLCKLGVTSLLLMPVYEFIEKETPGINMPLVSQLSGFRAADGAKNLNYWGFCKGFPYSIKASFAYSDDPVFEFKSLVYKLHQNNIECLLTVYSDLFDSPADICDLLAYYVSTFHIDGFRLVGSNRFADWIVKDPFLNGSKLIFEDPDLNAVREEGIRPYRNVSVISSDFMRQSRRFLKSDEETVAFMSYAVRENSKYYSPIRNVTDYEGFSLYDLYSYSRKHNDANNEDNRDGTNYNYSWNCGAEGETAKRSILSLRMKQCRNAFLLMFLSQGTPMITAGDECLNTNFGNNNPYCQDNEIGWVLYGNKKANREFREFTRNLIAFRKRHVILHQKQELMLFDYMSCKVPDVSFHSVEAWRIDQDPTAREFAVLYAGEYAKQYKGEAEDSVYVIYNMNWEPARFVLPVQGENVRWSLVYSSDGSTDDSFDEEKARLITTGSYMAGERSISVLLLSKEN